jgi:hypothetical protein
MAVADSRGPPVGLSIESAYDSDRLDAELRQYGIELIAPHRSNRKNKTQDGRRLRRYCRRWKLNGYSLACRTFAGLSFGTSGMPIIS